MVETRNILKNLSKIDPLSLQSYLSEGGFDAARKALTYSAEQIIDEISASGLRGRGGAGFPSGLKLKFTHKAKSSNGQKFLICNADEGEPGTFKDRIIMENDPFLVLESMIIAAYAIQASNAFIYIRAEYFLALERLQSAINQCYKANILGDSILNSAFCLDIEIKLGAGSYLCGEELTLIESLEGKRGNPRIKPPFPAEIGLFGKPTLVNNVETLANFPSILLNGFEWFKSLGIGNSSGTKIFNVSGDVVNPGTYELRMGTSLRTIIFDFAGGMAKSKSFKAALIGGAAGTFLNSSQLDVAMDYDSLAVANLSLGSGAIIVFNNERNIADVLSNILKFFKHESCGKCLPCRTGTFLISNEMLKRSTIGFTKENIEFIRKEALWMKSASLCPLGQSPILPVSTAIKHFSSDFYEVNPLTYE